MHTSAVHSVVHDLVRNLVHLCCPSVAPPPWLHCQKASAAEADTPRELQSGALYLTGNISRPVCAAACLPAKQAQGVVPDSCRSS